MSIEAIKYAFEKYVPRATDKLVLIALANYANAEGLAYPSHQRLMLVTSLNRKTIMASLLRLEQMGLLIDTGQRKGRTGRVVVYHMPEVNSPKNGTIAIVPELGPLNSPKNGTQNLKKRKDLTATAGLSGRGDLPAVEVVVSERGGRRGHH